MGQAMGNTNTVAAISNSPNKVAAREIRAD